MEKKTNPLVPLKSEIEILDLALNKAREAIPKTFKIEIEKMQAQLAAVSGADAILELKRANDEASRFAVEIKKTIDSSKLLKVIEDVHTQLEKIGRPLTVARYISAPAQEALRNLEISFADATGNLFVSVPEIGLMIKNRGLDKDPWREAGRPKSVLTGISTELIIRTLVDLPEPIKTSEIIKQSGAARGSAYWILDALEEAGFIERSGKSLIEKVFWKQLLEAWAQESSFFKTNETISFIAPRGLENLVENLKELDSETYVATGTMAASGLKQTAGLYTAIIYAMDLSAVANKLGLRKVESGANVILARPNSSAPFDRSREEAGVKLVSAAQAYRDLYWGPGRNPEEAKNLLAWMEQNVKIWRKKP